MNRRSQSIVIGFALLVAALVVYTQAGCGGAAEQRRKTLAVEVAAAKTARTLFHDWDVKRQELIGSTAPTRADGEKQLEKHRALRDAISRGFGYVFQQLADAAVASDEYSLVKAKQAAGQLIESVKTLKPDKEPPADLHFPCNAQNLEIPTQLDECP